MAKENEGWRNYEISNGSDEQFGLNREKLKE